MTFIHVFDIITIENSLVAINNNLYMLHVVYAKLIYVYIAQSVGQDEILEGCAHGC